MTSSLKKRQMIPIAVVAILLLITATAMAGKPSYDTPVSTFFYPFGVSPFYHAGGDGKDLVLDDTGSPVSYAAYVNGVDGTRSVFNGGDLILNLGYSRSTTYRSASVDLMAPAVDPNTGVDANGLAPVPRGTWSSTSFSLKVAAIQNVAVSDTAIYETTGSFDVKSADGKRWYRINFSGNYGTTRLKVMHPTATRWIVEAPQGSIARVSDSTGKVILIGNYFIDLKITVTMP